MIGIDRLLRRPSQRELPVAGQTDQKPDAMRKLGQAKPDVSYTGNYELNEIYQGRIARLALQANNGNNIK